MTNINCSCDDCVYQVDGKCRFESITATTITPNNNCAYYSNLNIKKVDD